jgi:hypothetical protein
MLDLQFYEHARVALAYGYASHKSCLRCYYTVCSHVNGLSVAMWP